MRWSLGLGALSVVMGCSSEAAHDSSESSAGKATSGATSGGAAGGANESGGSAGRETSGGATTAGNAGLAGLGGVGGMSGAGNESGAGGDDDDTSGLGVRFVGFVPEKEGADVPVGGDFLVKFPECPAELSTTLPPLSRFNECFARGIVRLMNSSLAELVPDAPHFRFESFELVADDRLAVFESQTTYSGYQLQHLMGNTYRRGDTMTFVMPSQYHGSVAGLADEDQRLNPDFGMLALAVPLSGAATLLHELGHAVGFPHAGNAAGVGVVEYEGCGGVTLDPPACLCEPTSFMSTYATFAETSGCDACETARGSTFDTEFFGPKYAAIAACWVSRRLEPSDLGFVEGDCFGLTDGNISTCFETEDGKVACKCPSGQPFSVDDCTDASQPARNAATAATCDRISCPPPAERAGVVCKGLAGGPTIECTCEDGKTFFYLGPDCSTLTLANIEKLCPAL